MFTLYNYHNNIKHRFKTMSARALGCGPAGCRAASSSPGSINRFKVWGSEAGDTWFERLRG